MCGENWGEREPGLSWEMQPQLESGCKLGTEREGAGNVEDGIRFSWASQGHVGILKAVGRHIFHVSYINANRVLELSSGYFSQEIFAHYQLRSW